MWTHVLLARVGYRQFVGEGNLFYVSPWAGVGTEYRIAGQTEVGDDRWRLSRFSYFASLNVGVQLF